MRSTFAILFYLKKGVPSEDKPIIGRITIDGESAQFTTKIKIPVTKWSVKKNKVIGHNKEATEINWRLDAIKAQLHTFYHYLLERDGYITAERLKNVFLGREEKEKSLLSFFEQHNELYKLKIGKTTTKPLITDMN